MQANRAVAADFLSKPSTLSLSATAAGSQTQSIAITNPEAVTATFTVSAHAPAGVTVSAQQPGGCPGQCGNGAGDFHSLGDRLYRTALEWILDLHQ